MQVWCWKISQVKTNDISICVCGSKQQETLFSYSPFMLPTHTYTTKNNKKTLFRWIDNNISNVQHPFHYILYMPNVHVDFYLLLQDFSNLWDCTWKQHCDKAFNQTTLLTLDCYIQKENKTLTRTKQQNKCSMFELPRTQTHSFYYSTR